MRRRTRGRRDFVFLFFCFEDVPLVEFMYLAFTHMPGESYRRRLRSLLECSLSSAD